MESAFITSSDLKDFFKNNREKFEQDLLNEAVNVRHKIEEILLIGNIDLLNNAHRLVIYVVDHNEEEVIQFANQEGVAWATHDLTLSFKLEWIQAIRRTFWAHLNQYFEENEYYDSDHFFLMEKNYNSQIDRFLNNFFISYSKCKDRMIEQQQRLVKNLSVPIIPISDSVSILPLIGELDYRRTKIIEEKVLQEIGNHHIQVLILDLSGIAEMEPEVIDHLSKIIEGTSMMGCETIITGLRPEIVRQMILLDVKLVKHAQTTGTLQNALKRFLHV